jgi:hypothetical protein
MRAVSTRNAISTTPVEITIVRLRKELMDKAMPCE